MVKLRRHIRNLGWVLVEVVKKIPIFLLLSDVLYVGST